MSDPAPPPDLPGDSTELPAPTPTRRIVTVRRAGAIRAGWACVAVGIILAAAGWLIGLGTQALQVAAAEGRAQVGNPVTFDTERTEYAIVLVPEPTTADFVEERISQLGCEVEHADGTTESLDVASAEVRTSTSIGTFATEFEGRGGATTVLCRWEGPSDYGSFYAVGRARKVTRYVGTGALVGGILIGLAGVSALVAGYRGRPEIQDIDAGPAASGISPGAR